MLPPRIAQMMVVDHLDLRVRPLRPVGSWTITGWSASIYCSDSNRWIWGSRPDAETPEAAIANLLERNAVDIERTCRELEEDGHDLPKAA